MICDAEQCTVSTAYNELPIQVSIVGFVVDVRARQGRVEKLFKSVIFVPRALDDMLS